MKKIKMYIITYSGDYEIVIYCSLSKELIEKKFKDLSKDCTRYSMLDCEVTDKFLTELCWG